MHWDDIPNSLVLFVQVGIHAEMDLITVNEFSVKIWGSVANCYRRCEAMTQNSPSNGLGLVGDVKSTIYSRTAVGQSVQY